MHGSQTILFLHPTPDRYGADLALLELVRGLDRSRWRAVVAVPGEGPLVALLRDAGAVVEDGPLGVLGRRTLAAPLAFLRFALEMPRAVRFVRRLVDRHRPALVHTNTSIVVGGALGARLSGARHLWHLHEIIAHPQWAARGFACVAARLADVVVSNSHATRHSFDRHSSALAARHCVVHNGIDAARLELTGGEAIGEPRDAAALEIRRAVGVEDRAPLVVLVGRVNAWKGQRLLLDAAARLRIRRPDARYLLVGDAAPGREELVTELRAEIGRRGLEGCVVHQSHREDVGRVFCAADVVVVPSTQPEPFGLVAAEAMAASRPVVAAAHGGVVEVVESGVTGLLFEPGDPAALAQALETLMVDPELARAMGRRGAERQRALFSRAGMLLEMDRVWSRLAGRTPALETDGPPARPAPAARPTPSEVAA